MDHKCSENHKQSQIDRDVWDMRPSTGPGAHRSLVISQKTLFNLATTTLFRRYTSQNVIKASNGRKQKALFSTNPAVTRRFQREIPRNSFIIVLLTLQIY